MSTKKKFDEHPKAKYWHPTKNGDLTPNKISNGSHLKYWFICNTCNHEFNKEIRLITSRNGWCPYCGKQELCDEDCKQCFENSFDSYEGMCCGSTNKKECDDKKCQCDRKKKIECWSSKNDMKPRQIFKVSGKKYIFNCVCGHEFDITPAHIKGNNWCPYCGNQKLCKQYGCKQCFDKSFASHEKSRFWSDTNRDQPEGYDGLYLPPRHVFKHTHIIYLLNCECGHEFNANLGSVLSGSWCPYCCNPPKKLCDKEDCKQCFDKSFASNDKAQFWSSKNKVKPRQVFKSSGVEYYFDCCHEIELPLNRISKGGWCHYCCDPSWKLCDKEDCNQCFDKSFASTDKARFWSNKNEVNPRQVFKSSGKEYIFKCSNNHEFGCPLNDITCSNRWCPYCINKTEQKLYELLSQIYPILERQYKEDWCKNKSCLPFDFVLKLLKIIIELDGPQHFIQINNWKSPEETRKGDIYKMECANKNGYSVIRLTQEDVFYDRYDWLSELVASIKKIIEEQVVQNIYLCKNNEYEHFNPI